MRFAAVGALLTKFERSSAWVLSVSNQDWVALMDQSALDDCYCMSVVVSLESLRPRAVQGIPQIASTV